MVTQLSIFANLLQLPWNLHPLIMKTHRVTTHVEPRAHAAMRFREGWDERPINPILACLTVLRVRQSAGACFCLPRVTYLILLTKCSHPNEVIVEVVEQAGLLDGYPFTS
jgi:hypothetical protein